jgi:tetratricopeptide (TPR) repeat protein
MLDFKVNDMLTKENGFTLPISWKCENPGQYAFTFITLLILLLAVYSNSFQGDWHFDDFPNIVKNSRIQIKSLSLPELKQSITGIYQDRLLRPFSYASFALNYYVGGLNVFGFHLVNFFIHYLSSVFLFLFIFNTLKLPLCKNQYENIAYPVALLATVLWSVHPVFVTSVSYIVQRMTSMAGLFYIMSMYFYLKGRMSKTKGKSIGFFIFCALAGLASLLTKENAVMLPFSILLFDLLLIQGATKENIKRFLKILIAPLLLFIIVGFLYTGGFSNAFSGYAGRDFTMYERLLTEPRVIIFYLSLLFYPIHSRLTLLYDIDISHSLLQPWTTLPAILLILFIIATAIYLCRKRPLMSFCILFFFLNHIIEGTVIPLELIYEHRNYLPAMFLFIPVAQFFVYVLDYFSYKRLLQIAVALGVIIIIVGLGDVTFRRNAIFSDEFLLWSDNIEKYPNLSRPYGNLGNAYMHYQQKEKGFKYFEKALAVDNFGNIHIRAVQENNMGKYYYMEGQYDEAFVFFEKSYKVNSSYRSNIIYMAKIHILKGENDLAHQLITSSINKASDHIDLLEILSLIHIKKKDYQKAEADAQKVLKKDLSRSFPLSVLAETSRIKGNLRSSIALWQLYQSTSPQDAYGNLALINLYNQTNDQEKLKKEIDKLYYLKGNVSISSYLKRLAQKKNLAVYIPEIDEIKMILNKNLAQIE